jgi:sugar/nucleoside kinase (ribokinase family)
MALPRFDVLGLGCIAVDDLLYVERYPVADTKNPIRRRQRQGGGLTGTALVAAARMGVSCQYAGCLGNDELSQFIRHRMHEEGIGLEYVKDDENIRPVHSIIVVDEESHSRTIFFDTEGAIRAADDLPSEEVIRAARVLFVDFWGIPGMIRAARVALAAGIPVVADFEHFSDSQDQNVAELVSLANHPIVPLDFARKWTGRTRPAEVLQSLWSSERQAVVVTCGAEGCWYLGEENPQAPRHQPAFPVTVVDTTGCGDVFHGVYAAALAQGLDLPARIKWASAAAALKATACGGQTGIPQRETVEHFLQADESV